MVNILKSLQDYMFKYKILFVMSDVGGPMQFVRSKKWKVRRKKLAVRGETEEDADGKFSKK